MESAVWFVLFLLFIFFVWVFGLLWALIDIARQKRDLGYKIIWVLICLIFGLIGVLAYYFVEVRRRKKE